jgi:hypothetical protein
VFIDQDYFKTTQSLIPFPTNKTFTIESKGKNIRLISLPDEKTAVNLKK